VSTFVGLEEAHGSYSNSIRLAIGGRAAGMGGAYRSISDDGNALFYNPGGMGFVEGSIMNADSGLIIARPEYTDPQNSGQDGNEGGSGIGGFPDFGIVTQIGDTPVRFGFSANTYTAIRMKYDINSAAAHATGGSTALADFDLGLIQNRFTPGLAMQVTDWLSVGGGYIFAYQSFNQKTPYEFTSAVENTGVSLAGTDYITDMDLDGTGHAGIFGALIKIGEKTQVGVSYTTKMDVDLEGNDLVEVASGAFDGQIIEYDIEMTYQWPQVVAAGISHQATDKLLLAFDWQWIDWSAAADKQQFLVTGGNNAVVTGVVGTSAKDHFLQDADDANVFHFGAEYQALEKLAVRAGYIFSENPVPSGTLTPLFNGNFEHTLSFGLGTELGGWEIDGAWSHAFENDQSVGTSLVVTGESEYDSSTTSNTNDIFFLSFRKPF